MCLHSIVLPVSLVQTEEEEVCVKLSQWSKSISQILGKNILLGLFYFK